MSELILECGLLIVVNASKHRLNSQLSTLIKTKKATILAAHSSRKLTKDLNPHPKTLRKGLERRAVVHAVALCKCMGRLTGLAQVHPGRSGLEKVDLPQVDVHRHLRVLLQARLGLDTSNDRFV